MNTTDIQRYPENYEILSTDAALRAEGIACRLRHLIYASTNVKKNEYLTSAAVMQDIHIQQRNGIVEITLPCLLPKRRQARSTEYLTAHRCAGAVCKIPCGQTVPALCGVLCPCLL